MAWTLILLDEADEVVCRVEDPDDYWIDPSLPDAGELTTYLDQHDFFERTGGVSMAPDDDDTFMVAWDGIRPITDTRIGLEELGSRLVGTFTPSEFRVVEE